MDVTDLVTQVPSAAALLVVISWVFRAQCRRDKVIEQWMTTVVDSLRESSRVVAANTEIQREVRELLRKRNGHGTPLGPTLSNPKGEHPR